MEPSAFSVSSSGSAPLVWCGFWGVWVSSHKGGPGSLLGGGWGVTRCWGSETSDPPVSTSPVCGGMLSLCVGVWGVWWLGSWLVVVLVVGVGAGVGLLFEIWIVDASTL